MKKTFSINISGSVFHIEDDAFGKLQAYLQLLNGYFGNQAGGQEILQDIEARIAELLQEKINDGQEVVSSEWVDEVIHRMGRPEDFTDQGEDTARDSSQVKGEKPKKRMYRDGENRVLGGVCSGMSAYFNIDPVFIRILFILLLFVGVGVSAIVYLVLWIVVPKARTTAQRLEMRGEDATITNIQKTIQEEVKSVKDSFSKIDQSDSFRKGKDMAGRAGQASARFIKGLGKAVSAAFGGLLILVGFAGFVSFMVSLAVGNSVIHSTSLGISPEVSFASLLGFVVSPTLVGVCILLAVLIIGIPLLAIFFVGTKLVFRYKTNNRLIGLAAFGIWLVALILMVALTAGQISNFSQRSTVSSGKTISGADSQTLYIELGAASADSESNEKTDFDDFTLVRQNGENVLAGNPSLRIEATDAADFSVVVRKQSRGRNASEVQENLGNIQYDLNSKDSTLVLAPYFTIGNQGKWRNQEVLVTVKVPTGKSVHLGKNLNRLRFRFENINNIWSPEMTGKTWVMTPEGLSLKE